MLFSCPAFVTGGNSQVHGSRGPGVQNQPGKHWVFQAGRCLLHGSGTVGDHLQVRRYRRWDMIGRTWLYRRTKCCFDQKRCFAVGGRSRSQNFGSQQELLWSLRDYYTLAFICGEISKDCTSLLSPPTEPFHDFFRLAEVSLSAKYEHYSLDQ